MNEKNSDSSDNIDENDTEFDGNEVTKEDSFRMYYALGPDIDQNSIIETVNSRRESFSPPEKDITDLSLSLSRSNQEITSIPPDIVTSAKKIRIITEEPRSIVVTGFLECLHLVIFTLWKYCCKVVGGSFPSTLWQKIPSIKKFIVSLLITNQELLLSS